VYLVEYTLMMGRSRHYSPSAMAAARLVRDIKAGGGTLTEIMRTRDRKTLTIVELEELAGAEVGPMDEKSRTLAQAFKRLMAWRRSDGSSS